MNAMTSPYGGRGVSRAGLAVVVALHLLAFWALLRMEVFSLPAPLALLEVSLLAPPLPETPPKPAIMPPKPRPVEKRPAPRPVRETAPLALPVDAPVAAAAPPGELPTVSPEPTFAPPASPAPTQPRFDADYLDNPRPVYPALARRLGEQGRVLLRVRVAADGLPLDVELQAGSGSPRLDQAAIDTVRRWKFVPARLGNEAIVATVLVPIAFSLKD
jgi:protein TonB